MTHAAASGSVGGTMQVRITEKGVSIELSAGEALVFLDEAGDLPARAKPKMRQIHRAVETALTWRSNGAERQPQ